MVYARRPHPVLSDYDVVTLDTGVHHELMDEIVKGNYSFDINDLVGPGITHEKIFLALVLLAVLLGLRWRRGG